MKKFMIVVFVAAFVCGMTPLAQAQTPDAETTEFISILSQELKELLKADNVMGTPIEHGGTKIIPVVSYGFGFGGGSGTGTGRGEQGKGTGAGSGGGVMPVSFLIIHADGEIQVVSAEKGGFSEVMKAVAPMILEAVKTRQEAPQEGGKKEDTPPPPPEKEE